MDNSDYHRFCRETFDREFRAAYRTGRHEQAEPHELAVRRIVLAVLDGWPQLDGLQKNAVLRLTEEVTAYPQAVREFFESVDAGEA